MLEPEDRDQSTQVSCSLACHEKGYQAFAPMQVESSKNMMKATLTS